MSQGASRAGMMARLMAAATALGNGKMPFSPAADLVGDSKSNERRKRASGSHPMHKQAVGSWRRSKAVWLPHQGARECARRVRQMARDGTLRLAAAK